jgi:dephospho-CoA kinase
VTSRPLVIGLTGSIGMGKTTTARLFAEAGIPVWDADAAVHRLYGPERPGTRAIAQLVPEAVGPKGVERPTLRAAIAADPSILPCVEAAVHPLVEADRAAFLSAHREAPIVVVDIPLLFETGAEGSVDVVVVVTAPAEVQHARVLARPGMDEAGLARLLARQVPDAEKRRRADHVVRTDGGLDRARRDVVSIITHLRKGRHA